MALELTKLEEKWIHLITYAISSYLDKLLVNNVVSIIFELLKTNLVISATKRIYEMGSSMAEYVSQSLRAKHDKSLKKSEEKLLSEGVARRYHVIVGYDTVTKKGEVAAYYKQETFYLYCKLEYSLPSFRRIVYHDVRDVEGIVSMIGNSPFFMITDIITVATELDNYHINNNHLLCQCKRCLSTTTHIANHNSPVMYNNDNNEMYHHK